MAINTLIKEFERRAALNERRAIDAELREELAGQQAVQYRNYAEMYRKWIAQAAKKQSKSDAELLEQANKRAEARKKREAKRQAELDSLEELEGTDEVL